MLIKIFVLAAVISGCNCQLTGLCNTLLDDMQTCVSENIGSISELANLFTSASAPLDLGSSFTSLSVMCKYETPLKNFYRCFYNRFLACIPNQWTKALASTSQVLDSISYICNNVGDLDLPCVINNVQKVIPCVSTALSKQSTADVSTVDGYIAYMCRTYPLMEGCLRSTMSVCSGRSSEVLIEYLKYQTPATCDATMVTFHGTLLVISLCYTWLTNQI